MSSQKIELVISAKDQASSALKGIAAQVSAAAATTRAKAAEAAAALPPIATAASAAGDALNVAGGQAEQMAAAAWAGAERAAGGLSALKSAAAESGKNLLQVGDRAAGMAAGTKTSAAAAAEAVKPISKAADAAGNALSRAGDQAAGMAGTIRSRASAATAALSPLKRMIASIGSALTSLKTMAVAALTGWGIKRLAGSFIDVGASMDQMRISLDTITKGEGERWFGELNAWAMKMPVNTEKAIASFTMMRAMGLKPTIADMTTLVDTTSALGGQSDTMESIARALGQIQTKGKVSAEELMQLAERGVPAYEILREKLGLTAAQVANIGNEAISGGVAVKALIEGMADRFAGQSDKIQNKWAGMIESLKSYWTEFRRLVMDSGAMATLEANLGRVIAKLDEMSASGELAEVAARVGASVSSAIDKTVRSLAQAYDWWVRNERAVKEYIGRIVDVTKELGALYIGAKVVAGITGVATFFAGLATAMKAATFQATALNTAMKANLVFLAGYAGYKAGSWLYDLFGGDASSGNMARMEEEIARRRKINEDLDRQIRDKYAGAAAAGSGMPKAGFGALTAESVGQAAADASAKMIEALVKVAEADRDLLNKRLGEYQTYQQQLRQELEKTVDAERRSIREVTDLYRQQADVRRGTQDLVSGLMGQTLNPIEQYQSQRSDLTRQYLQAMQNLTGQDLVKALDAYKQGVSELAKQFRDGIGGVSGRDVIGAAISDIERAGQAQQEALRALAAEKARQVQTDRDWGESLRRTARMVDAEIESLRATVAELSSQIAAADRVIAIDAQDWATPVVEQIQAAIDALHDKTVTITTIHRSIVEEITAPVGTTIRTVVSGSYAKGTLNVPKTAPYLIHQGEIVVARQAAEAVRQSPIMRAVVGGDMTPADAARQMIIERTRESVSSSTRELVEKTGPVVSFTGQPVSPLAAYPAVQQQLMDSGGRTAQQGATIGRQITVDGGIHIHLPANAAPRDDRDWRRIVRAYILPELSAVGR